MTSFVLPRGVRQPVETDLPEIAGLLAAAFFDDPVWGPTFPDPKQRLSQATEYWSFMAAQGLRCDDSLVAVGDDGAIRAVAIWFPEGEDEVAPESHEDYAELVRRLLPADAAQMLFDVGDRFEEARPTKPHAYLSLLAVAPEARGKGEGMALLRLSIERYDAFGIDTYLESSNPANDARYEKQGYLPRGHIEMPRGRRCRPTGVMPAPPPRLSVLCRKFASHLPALRRRIASLSSFDDATASPHSSASRRIQRSTGICKVTCDTGH
ncbi:GNAT family N-acetyltransferase [Leucobacter insecticola]|uniref:GNAT family N-acetyltransferase n=1 Tax=Leucobacter insecticola TaxID=2714934 RepID=A0A6G8FG46_9MICO|nr:GNAT family N-acetyltransferase [Leucobacter insecticola]QIM15338.1 GNAT family N-acetyltransferase [Leucobacter insecticola]